MDLKEIEWSRKRYPPISWKGPWMGSWEHDNKHLLWKN